MSNLLKHLRPYRRQAILGPLFKLLEATLELFVPLIVASVIDNGIQAGDRSYVIKMTLALAALGLVGLLFSVTAQYYSATASVGFASKLRRVLFEHIQGFSYETLDRIGIPTLITRMSADMNQVQTGLNLTLRLLLRSPFVVFGAMIMAFTIDIRAALWFVAAIPVLAIVVFGIMLITMPLYKKVQSHLDRVLGATRENLNGVRVLRAFRKEEDEIAGFVDKNTALTATQLRVGRISALMNPLTYVIINLTILLLIRTGAIQVDSGTLSQGAVVALYNYMSQILVELIKLANLIINITKAVSCGKRIQSVLDIPTGEKIERDLPGSDPRFSVEFVNAGLRYTGASGSALQGLNLRVKPGETIGVIGGTGSGKTTLINLIPRLYTATEGKVFVNGQDVRSLDPSELRKRIGVVPQKAVLFQGTIRDNLKWGRDDADDSTILDAAAAAQATDVISSKMGLDGPVEQFGRNFSGGQRQRLTIARALVRKPEILILDDSSSALDYATDAALRSALRNLIGKPTVFLVSQRTSAVQDADQIVVLDEGRVAGIGKHEWLVANCGVYREIYESQFKKEAAL